MHRLTPALAADPSPAVRLQAAIAARKLMPITTAAPYLLRILRASEDDPMIRHVVERGLRLSPSDYTQLPDFVAQADATGSPAVADLWPRALARAADSEALSGPALARLLRFGLTIGRPEQHSAMLEAVSVALNNDALTGRRLELFTRELGDELQPLTSQTADPRHLSALRLAAGLGDSEALDALRRLVADAMADPAARGGSLEVLVTRRDPTVLEAAVGLLADVGTPQSLRRRALDALSDLDDPQVAHRLLDAYASLDAGLRNEAIVVLTERPAWGRALADAIAADRVPKTHLNLNHVRKLKALNDAEINDFVAKTWGALREGRDERREMVVGQMRNFLRKTPGDPMAGKPVFDRVCAQCHKIYGQGQEVGPEITLNGRNDFDQLISNVFDPSLVIGPGYQAINVATHDGRVLTGLLAEDGPDRVVLKLQGGKLETIPRSEVDEVLVTPISLMPEAIETQLTPQEIADLFAYLALDRPPEDPDARRLPGAPEPAKK
jgi:putative heme-binding domain-containing protein